jgi:hypothetical protein
MSDREGVSPEGETPERVHETAPPAGQTEPVEPVEPDSPESDSRESDSPESDSPAESDLLAEQSEPAEPTLRADPAVREFDVPFDTGELRSLPTGQLLVVHRPELPAEASGAVEEETQRRVYSWIAAIVGTMGAIASLFVGWMLPLSIAAIVFGVLGLRREEEGRTLAFVGIGTGITGLVFAAVWIGYYAIVFGALPR